MQQNQNDIELLEDKAKAEALFGKSSLAQMEEVNNEVPLDYFNQFEARVLHTIKKNKTRASIFNIGKYAQLAVAASLLIIAATTFAYIQSNKAETPASIALNIQEIPSEEIDSYVNANEEIAEIDWQSEINKEGSSLELINPQFSKDSNKTQ
jgi:hypothetical protein